jgi:hypothetical protein
VLIRLRSMGGIKLRLIRVWRASLDRRRLSPAAALEPPTLYSQRSGRRGYPSTPDPVGRPPMKATVNAALGVVCVLLGVAAVYAAMPNQRGESPRFMRSGAAELLYAPLCLSLFVAGVAMILAG